MPSALKFADFPGLITVKFRDTTLFAEEANYVDLSSSSGSVTDYEEDCSFDERLRPGLRDKETAPSLRIYKLQMIVDKRKTLSKKRRESLLSRKNTIIFRERRRLADSHSKFMKEDLD